MNKFVITYLLSITFAYTLNAQIRMYDIFTPIGNPVTTWLMTESALQTRQGFDSHYATTYPNAVQIKTYDNLSSTRKFNCHGYAWLRVEQGIDRWIGLSVTTEEDIYMSDGSYRQVSKETYPGKVSWGSRDHSAVTTSTPGVFISKWNEWPLMQHAKNYSPFGTSNLKYYERVYPSINGPRYLNVYSGGTKTYSLANPPLGTVTWEKSAGSSFDLSTTTGNSTTVTMTGAGSGTLTAKVNGTVVATQTIETSTATVDGPINGPNGVYPGYGSTVTYELEYVPGLTYSWSSNGNLVMRSDNGSYYCTFDIPSYYTGGTTDVISCYVTAGGSVVVGSFSLDIDIY